MKLEHEIESEKFMAKLVVARFTDGKMNMIGRCLAYCGDPQVLIRDQNGEKVWWRADMCAVVEMGNLSEEEAATLLPLGGSK